MSFILKMRSGKKDIAAAGTAERLISSSSEASRFTTVTISARGDHTIIIGGSGALLTASAEEGLYVSDGTGAAGSSQSVTLTVADGDRRGMKFDQGPFIDLFEIFADTLTSGHNVFWFGW